MRLIAALVLGLLWAAGLPAAALAAAENAPPAAQRDASDRTGVLVESKPGFWTLSPNPGDPAPGAPTVVTGRIDCTRGTAPAASCPPPPYTEAYAYPEEPDWAELPWSFEFVPVIVVERPIHHFHRHFPFRRHFARGVGHRFGSGLGHATPGAGHSLAASFGSFFGSFR